MNIRQLVAKDADQYLNIRLEALQKAPEAFASSYEEEKNQLPDKYKGRFDSPQNSFTFGAFNGDELVGVVTLIKETRSKLLHRANIVAMFVKEEERGHGLGKLLLTEAINKASELNEVEQVYLSVVTKNKAAKQLYLSSGFKVFGTEKNALKFKDRYYDEDQMVLFL